MLRVFANLTLALQMYIVISGGACDYIYNSLRGMLN